MKGSNYMNSAIFTVNGMSCGHCVKAVERAVGALQGISMAKVDLAAKTLSVEFDSSKVSLEDIKKVVVEEGYEIA